MGTLDLGEEDKPGRPAGLDGKMLGVQVQVGSAGSTAAKPGLHQRLLRQAQHFVVSNFLILGFVVAVVWALKYPSLGQAIGSIRWHVRIVPFLNNCMVFLVSGLTLRMSHFKKLGAHFHTVMYGMLVILAITPFLSLIALHLPLSPIEFRQGLAIFAIVPTTLGIGVALVQAAHGNLAMALVLTVSTNIIGVFTVPYVAQGFVSQADETGEDMLDPMTLVTKLLITVLAPTLVGMAIRAASRPARRWITHHRTALSMLSSVNLFSVVWISMSAARDIVLQQRAINLLGVGLVASSLFAILLAINFYVAHHLLRIDPPEVVAITIMASMKSGVVGIAVASFLTTDLATAGLLIIPSVIGQLSQVLMGSAVAHQLGKWALEEERARALTTTKARQQQAVVEGQSLLAASQAKAYTTIEEVRAVVEEDEDGPAEVEEEVALATGV